ncbi:MAG: hypothetical protein K2J48_08340 [Muribaculaceae bacterium]|nr:hypothetical protein [Muribaculaceae bacterium]
MKQKILIILLTFLFVAGSFECASADDNMELETYLVDNAATGQDDSDEEPTTPLIPNKERCPAAPLFCSISKVGGIQISGIDSAEIVCFEILDAYGHTVALLQDEPSFIETIFSLNGEYRIVFRLQNKILSGWINKTIS